MQWISSFRDGLEKTRNELAGHWNSLIGRQLVEDAFWQDLEESLIAADFGVATTEKVIGQLKIAAQQRNLRVAADVIKVLKEDLGDYLRHAALAPAPGVA